ncbi:MAG: phosphate ABC transporter permease subunit PstC [Kiloniellales bacterium]|nr:phosphate ABC transporter permease subunit PstC [Kiloniellales bacterium]MDJ0970082.1 phosphate ABC transporter permease subunit PstC [Kiloniellales bacterium]MDJ0980747.1 phosphate ABC transporter permease subunit PstC [Kiloniellales bacterium]
MSVFAFLITFGVLCAFGFYLGRRRALARAGGHTSTLHSRPHYYGFYVALWCGLPALMVALAWLVLEPLIAGWVLMANLPASAATMSEGQLSLLITDIKNLATGNFTSRAADPELVAAADSYANFREIGRMAVFGAMLAVAIGGLGLAHQRVLPQLRARNSVERVAMVIMQVASTIAILTTIGIVGSLLFEALRFFGKVPVTEFLFGLDWSPQTALRADQVGASGAFGAIPLFAGTLMITLIAMFVAVPIGLFSAIYMSEYATPKIRATVKPILEVLAGVPTVVYGFFAALTVAPFFRNFGESLGLTVSSESALAAGMVMGIMIIPFVSSLSDDVMNAVPQSLRDGAYALGATKAETIKQVIVPAALPGIVGGVLLAVSRAIGETMIVVMAAGLAANLTANPLEAVTTVTVQIVTLLVGDQEFDSAKTLAAFALGLMLFAVTLVLNVAALHVVRKYREKYD